MHIAKAPGEIPPVLSAGFAGMNPMNLTKSFPLASLLVTTLCLTCMVKVTDAAGPKPADSGAVKAENSTALKFDRLDPAVDAIIPAGAKLERVATGFTWTEGPVWAGDSLYFANIPANKILKWTPGAGVGTFLEPSGYKEAEPYNGPEPDRTG